MRWTASNPFLFGHLTADFRKKMIMATQRKGGKIKKKRKKLLRSTVALQIWWGSTGEFCRVGKKGKLYIPLLCIYIHQLNWTSYSSVLFDGLTLFDIVLCRSFSICGVCVIFPFKLRIRLKKTVIELLDKSRNNQLMVPRIDNFFNFHVMKVFRLPKLFNTSFDEKFAFPQRIYKFCLQIYFFQNYNDGQQ